MKYIEDEELRKLYTDTVAVLAAVDRQIQVVRNNARNQGQDPHHLTLRDGKFVMSDLLLAKSTALHTISIIAQINENSKNSKDT